MDQIMAQNSSKVPLFKFVPQDLWLWIEVLKPCIRNVASQGFGNLESYPNGDIIL